MQSERSWTVYRYTELSQDSTTGGVSGAEGEPVNVVPEFETLSPFKAPFGVDLRVNFDWHVSHRVTLFAEGRNLLNQSLYEQAWFPELGANFTVGIKANF